MNRQSISLPVRAFLLAALFCLLAALGVWTRTVPHPSAVTPVVASTLFFAYISGSSWAGLLLAPLTLFLGDRILGGYDGRIMACVYAAAAFPALLRIVLAQRLTIARLVACSLLSSVVFFLFTNLAVWAFGAPESTYPHSVAGLAECYAAGLPFFRNAALGDLAWLGAFFGLYTLGQAVTRKYFIEAPAAVWREETAAADAK